MTLTSIKVNTLPCFNAWLFITSAKSKVLFRSHSEINGLVADGFLICFCLPKGEPYSHVILTRIPKKRHVNKFSQAFRKSFGDSVKGHYFLRFLHKHVCKYRREKLFFILLIMFSSIFIWAENFKEHRNQIFLSFESIFSCI